MIENVICYEKYQLQGSMSTVEVGNLTNTRLDDLKYSFHRHMFIIIYQILWHDVQPIRGKLSNKSLSFNHCNIQT